MATEQPDFFAIHAKEQFEREQARKRRQELEVNPFAPTPLMWMMFLGTVVLTVWMIVKFHEADKVKTLHAQQHAHGVDHPHDRVMDHNFSSYKECRVP